MTKVSLTAGESTHNLFLNHKLRVLKSGPESVASFWFYDYILVHVTVHNDSLALAQSASPM